MKTCEYVLVFNAKKIEETHSARAVILIWNLLWKNQVNFSTEDAAADWVIEWVYNDNQNKPLTHWQQKAK